MNPRLRFKRDDGTDYPDWEEKKLGEVLTQRRDIQTISDKAPLLAFTIEDGVIDPKDKKTNKRDFLIKDKENKKFQLTKYDDIIYNPANIKFGAIHRNKFGEGVVSPIYVILKTNQNPSFVEYSLKRERFISKTKKYLEGTVEKLRTLKPENFLSLSMFFPCIEEQEKIGSFLSDIDEVILTTSQEIKKLEELKKGVMQKIFSQEVRFKRENGTNYPDWEEKKLGELGDFTKGANLSKADISEIGTPFILYGELYTTYDEVAYDIKRKTEAIVEEKYYSKIGDVVIPTSGETAEEISKATCVMQDGVILAGDLNIFRNNIVDGRIISYIINYQVKKDIAKIAQGKMIVHLQAKNLAKILISYPVDREEQEKIADCLSAFDEAISLSKQELDKWKLLKKGFLQQMFV